MTTYTAHLTPPHPRPHRDATYRHPLAAGRTPAALWITGRLVGLAGTAASLLAVLVLLHGASNDADPATGALLTWVGIAVASVIGARMIRRATAVRVPGVFGYRTIDDPAPPWTQVLLREAAYAVSAAASIAVTSWALTLPDAQERVTAAGSLEGMTSGTILGYMLLIGLGAVAPMYLRLSPPAPTRGHLADTAVSNAVTVGVLAAEWYVIVACTEINLGLEPVALGLGFGVVLVVLRRVIRGLRNDMAADRARDAATAQPDKARPWAADRPWSENVTGTVLTWWTGSATVPDRQRAARWLRIGLVVVAGLLLLAWITT